MKLFNRSPSIIGPIIGILLMILGTIAIAIITINSATKTPIDQLTFLTNRNSRIVIQEHQYWVRDRDSLNLIKSEYRKLLSNYNKLRSTKCVAESD